MGEHDLIVATLLDDFRYGHLPSHLQVVSKQFADLAERMVTDLWLDEGPNYQLINGLWDLLRAKDSFVRQAVVA